MKKIIGWIDERLGIVQFYNNQVAFELSESVTLWHFFSGLTIGCVGIQFLTGFYMVMYYVPEPNLAHQSIREMCQMSSFGALMRNLHRWSATFGAFFVMLHVFHTMGRKAYKSPRELNWFTGLVLGVIFLLFLITGIIAPWDWRSYWELIIWADWVDLIPMVGNSLKGLILGSFTLGRNFAVHIIMLPILFFAVLFVHIVLTRRLGLAKKV